MPTAAVVIRIWQVGLSWSGDEADQLLEHAQGMKMSLREAVEFFSVLIDSSVFPIHKVKEVPRHCSALLGLDESQSAGLACKNKWSDPV